MPLDDGRLIDLVHRYSFLYDRKRSDFKDVTKRDFAWKEIAKELRYSDEECKKRWISIREKYVREKNYKESGNETVKQWNLFNSLKWLNPYIVKRKNKTYFDLPLTIKTEDYQYSEFEEGAALDGISSPSPGLSVHSDPFTSAGSSTSYDCKRQNQSTDTGNNTMLESLHDMGVAFEYVPEGISSKRNIEEDEDDHFARLIRAFLKKRKPSKRKKKFYRLVFNAMMDYSDSE